MNLRKFGLALLCKSLWKAIFGDSIWSNAIKIKYLGKRDFIFWYRLGYFEHARGSTIWRSFHKIEVFFFKNIMWKFQFGNSILIGIDPFMGREEVSHIPHLLLHMFHQKSIFYWAQVINEWQGALPIWKFANDLGLYGQAASQWNMIFWKMKLCGIYRSVEEDNIVWWGGW